MLSDRLSIKVDIVTQTPLRIGTGDYVEDNQLQFLDKQTGEKIIPQVADVARDINHHPYLPGSTIKGILRSICTQQQYDKQQIHAFFGRSDEGDRTDVMDHASMGLCYFRNAYLIKENITVNTALPNYQSDKVTATLTRTSINRQSGCADDKKLFHQAVVPPGIHFRMALTVFADSVGQWDWELLQALLSYLATDDCVALGAHQRTGMGIVKADLATLEVTCKRLNDVGLLVENENKDKDEFFDKTKRQPPDNLNRLWSEQSQTMALNLDCEGPFIIIGERQATSHPLADDGTSSSENREPQIKALKLAKDHPWLPGSSVLGVLRAECALLQKINQLKLAKSTNEPNGRDDYGLVYSENSSLQQAIHDPNQLSPVERLFGVTGWRGLLRIVAIKLNNQPEDIEITSVKIDRFSGGPIDNALFTTQAALKPSFRLTLALDDRAESSDEAMLQALITRIKRRGLMLGHGNNKGFGWFKVQEPLAVKR